MHLFLSRFISCSHELCPRTRNVAALSIPAGFSLIRGLHAIFYPRRFHWRIYYDFLELFYLEALLSLTIISLFFPIFLKFKPCLIHSIRKYEFDVFTKPAPKFR